MAASLRLKLNFMCKMHIKHIWNLAIITIYIQIKFWYNDICEKLSKNQNKFMRGVMQRMFWHRNYTICSSPFMSLSQFQSRLRNFSETLILVGLWTFNKNNVLRLNKIYAIFTEFLCFLILFFAISSSRLDEHSSQYTGGLPFFWIYSNLCLQHWHILVSFKFFSRLR